MKRSFLLLLMALPLFAAAQLQVGHSGSAIRDHWKKQQAAGVRSTVTARSKQLLLVTVQGEKGTARNYYELDSAGICQVQRLETEDTTVAGDFLTQLLALPTYQWKKLNENQYISRFEDHVLVELPADGSMKYVKIIRMNWNRTLYDLLSTPGQ